MKRPRLMLAVPVKGLVRARPGELLQIPPIEPYMREVVAEAELGERTVQLTLVALFVGGQGRWEVGCQIHSGDGTPWSDRLHGSLYCEQPLIPGAVCFEITLLLDRIGFYVFVLDLAGEEIVRVPFRVVRSEQPED